MQEGTNLKCKCSGCIASENARNEINLPYRYVPTKGHNIFHLTLHILLPALGTFLIGFKPLAVVPVLSFIVFYLVSCFIFCSTCSYHHEDVRLCGCFPKSIFKNKRYKKWGYLENIIGWPLAIILLIGPTIFILIKLNDWNALKVYLSFLFLVVLFQGVFSCGKCRQRSLCYLGKLVIKLRN